MPACLTLGVSVQKMDYCLKDERYGNNSDVLSFLQVLITSSQEAQHQITLWFKPGNYHSRRHSCRMQSLSYLFFLILQHPLGSGYFESESSSSSSSGRLKIYSMSFSSLSRVISTWFRKNNFRLFFRTSYADDQPSSKENINFPVFLDLKMCV